MNSTGSRPFNAATSKLAYAQAFTKPTLRRQDSSARRRTGLPVLAALLRLTHH
jgi:hypothetical protein